jgi:predicted acylesterase/phospholipase RssA
MSTTATEPTPAAAPTPAPAPPKDNAANPPLECDLVMKGGITSGVVYPAAVMVLKDRYRFRSIGGASAGAIAAAFTAAAELGREEGEAKGGCGFRQLELVRKEILDGKKQTLRRLFRAAGPTAPLLNMLVELTTKSPLTRRGIAFALLKHFAIWAVIGALLVAAIGLGVSMLLALLYGQSSIVATVLFVVLGAALGAMIIPLLRIKMILFRYLPKHGFFGLCQGFIENDNDVLTTWLHDRVEQLAGNSGRQEPLTFAHLAQKGQAQAKSRSIQLRMMTSNLSHHQPYVFPRPKEEGKVFIFNELEFRALFPQKVVDYLVNYWNAPRDDVKAKRRPIVLAKHFYFLPTGDDLPVIVATRMSLSFPVLLSAIPLYTIKPTAFRDFRKNKIDVIGQSELQRNWISDGGISSNFPIHFFDGFLPSRPTFGMNLNYLSKDFKPTKKATVHADAMSELHCDAANDAIADAVAANTNEEFDDVLLPSLTQQQYARPQWAPVEKIPSFIGALFTTAKDYRDNMQMMLPSYRDRTVQIWLRHDEGGMNLAMPDTILKGIDGKGKEAGDELLSGKFNMRQHQWVRLRVLMAAMEPQLKRMHSNFASRDHYRKLLDEQLAADPRWYKGRDCDWCDAAQQRLELLVEYLDRWSKLDQLFADAAAESAFFGEDPPHPAGVLRVTPNV